MCFTIRQGKKKPLLGNVKKFHTNRKQEDKIKAILKENHELLKSNTEFKKKVDELTKIHIGNSRTEEKIQSSSSKIEERCQSGWKAYDSNCQGFNS